MSYATLAAVENGDYKGIRDSTLIPLSKFLDTPVKELRQRYTNWRLSLREKEELSSIDSGEGFS